MLGVLLLVGLSVDACIDFEPYCLEKIDCEDGNDADVEACVISGEAEEDIAELYGCTDEFTLFAECREKDASCENDQYILDPKDCDDESREYGRCLSDNLPGGPF